MRLVVGPRRPLEVLVPKKTSDREIDAFLTSKRRWINEKVASARAIASRPPQLGLQLPSTAWIGGDPYPIERRSGQRSVAELDDEKVIVHGPAVDAPAALERWYRREARTHLVEATETGGAASRPLLSLDQHPRPKDALGVVLEPGQPLLLLAPDPRPTRGARVRRGTRTPPSAGAEPQQGLLAPRRDRASRLAGAGPMATRERAGAARILPGLDAGLTEATDGLERRVGDRVSPSRFEEWAGRALPRCGAPRRDARSAWGLVAGRRRRT